MASFDALWKIIGFEKNGVLNSAHLPAYMSVLNFPDVKQVLKIFHKVAELANPAQSCCPRSLEDPI
jgi:hypothetical protein